METNHKVDKDFCLSSYIAYRYIYKDGVDFFSDTYHQNIKPIPPEDRIPVKSAEEIDRAVQSQINDLYKKYNKISILLSGGMDSAIIATYLKPGSNAYTFTTKLSDVYNQDFERAKKYCELLNLNCHPIDISFEDYRKYTPIVTKHKGAPVHSIEPQIYKAAITAKENGDELMLIGESSDLIFGGMDQLLSKDWDFDAFVKRYTFLDPNTVLKNPVDTTEIFEKYRLSNNKIDFRKFMDEVFSIESSSSYFNAFTTADLPYYDPYAKLIMGNPLNLDRVRNGESKYLIRELFAKKYPTIKIPEKIPMPRPVDKIFENWSGPKRAEFIELSVPIKLTGNQKWQLWCAEEFLNDHDKMSS